MALTATVPDIVELFNRNYVASTQLPHGITNVGVEEGSCKSTSLTSPGVSRRNVLKTNHLIQTAVKIYNNIATTFLTTRTNKIVILSTRHSHVGATTVIASKRKR